MHIKRKNLLPDMRFIVQNLTQELVLYMEIVEKEQLIKRNYTQ